MHIMIASNDKYVEAQEVLRNIIVILEALIT